MHCVGEIQFLGFAAGCTYNNHCALKVGPYAVFQRTVPVNSVISIYLSRRILLTQPRDVCLSPQFAHKLRTFLQPPPLPSCATGMHAM